MYICILYIYPVDTFLTWLFPANQKKSISSEITKFPQSIAICNVLRHFSLCGASPSSLATAKQFWLGALSNNYPLCGVLPPPVDLWPHDGYICVFVNLCSCVFVYLCICVFVYLCTCVFVCCTSPYYLLPVDPWPHDGHKTEGGTDPGVPPKIYWAYAWKTLRFSWALPFKSTCLSHYTYIEIMLDFVFRKLFDFMHWLMMMMSW